MCFSIVQSKWSGSPYKYNGLCGVTEYVRRHCVYNMWVLSIKLQDKYIIETKVNW